jgi:hypothetical protein
MLNGAPEFATIIGESETFQGKLKLPKGMKRSWMSKLVRP